MYGVKYPNVKKVRIDRINGNSNRARFHVVLANKDMIERKI